MDIQNSTTNSKLTYSVEIIPICKDDVVCLPAKVARAMSNIAQIVICHRVGNQIYLIDPLTLTLGDISANVYYRNPFPPLADITQATEFIVLDIEPTSHPPKTAKGGRFLLADAQVSPVGGSMNADVIYHTRTHLGAVLKPGDTVQGYMLASSNFNNDAWDAMNQTRTPEVVLVRKTYPNRRKKSKARGWRLKSIVCWFSVPVSTSWLTTRTRRSRTSVAWPSETTRSDSVASAHRRRSSTVEPVPPSRQRQRQTTSASFGTFHHFADRQAHGSLFQSLHRDLEEDEELRQTINIFKGEKKEDAAMTDDSDMETDDEDELPEINVNELLDDMDNLVIDDDEGSEAE